MSSQFYPDHVPGIEDIQAEAARWYSYFGRILLFMNPGCTNADLIGQQTASLRDNTSLQLPFRNTLPLTTQPSVEQTLDVLEENFRDGDLVLGCSGDGGHGTLIGAIIEGGFDTAFVHISSGGQNDQAHMLHPKKLLSGDPLQLLASDQGRLVDIATLLVTKTAPNGTVSERSATGYYTLGYTADVTNGVNSQPYRAEKAAKSSVMSKKIMDARMCLKAMNGQSFDITHDGNTRRISELSIVNGTMMAGQLRFRGNDLDIPGAAIVEVGQAARLNRIGYRAGLAAIGRFSDSLKPDSLLSFSVGESFDKDGNPGKGLRDEFDGEDGLLLPGTQVTVQIKGSVRALKTKKPSPREILLQSIT